MITSKYGKSYYSSNGSEQHHEVTTQRVSGDEERVIRQREDDGGPIDDSATCDFAGKLTSKPPWSVLSLHDLNEAIRQAHDPARLKAEQAQQVERQKVRSLHERHRKLASAARAERDRYRNAWEHTV